MQGNLDNSSHRKRGIYSIKSIFNKGIDTKSVFLINI